MFGKVAKSISALFSGGEVERWTPEKLAEVKAYLETKPSEAFTREDHRYYPKDESITKAAWEKRRRELCVKSSLISSEILSARWQVAFARRICAFSDRCCTVPTKTVATLICWWMHYPAQHYLTLAVCKLSWKRC